MPGEIASMIQNNRPILPRGRAQYPPDLLQVKP
jgi:hypothetical protein